MSAGLQITGWPAHDSAISSILFGPDETSIFSLGSDGKASSFTLFMAWINQALRFCSFISWNLYMLEIYYFIPSAYLTQNWLCNARFLNGVCKTKVKSFGQGIVAGTLITWHHSINSRYIAYALDWMTYFNG